MSATLVPAVKTTYTSDQMIGGFVQGWIEQFAVIPTKASIGVLWAQSSLETGGTTSMWSNNIGNVKFVLSANPADDDGKEYMMLANVWEIINGVKQIYQPPSPYTWFRAFPTLAEGVAFQLDFLKNHRYASAWSAVEAGSPAEFAHLLKLAGYYTASEIDYTNDMNYYFNKFMADPTFDNVITALQPQLIVDPTTGNVSISGDIDLAPEPSSVWNTVINLFK